MCLTPNLGDLVHRPRIHCDLFATDRLLCTSPTPGTSRTIDSVLPRTSSDGTCPRSVTTSPSVSTLILSDGISFDSDNAVLTFDVSAALSEVSLAAYAAL